MIEYLHITNQRSYTAKTLEWDVMNDGGELLGSIRWYAPWRKYCFYTNANAAYFVFCDNCLTQLSTFCKTATQNHKHANQQNRSQKLQQSQRDSA